MNRGATPSSNNMNPLLDFNHQILDLSQHTNLIKRTSLIEYLKRQTNTKTSFIQHLSSFELKYFTNNSTHLERSKTSNLNN